MHASGASSTRLPPPATSLAMTWTSDISDFYANFPIQSAVLTCGVKASVADMIAQLKGGTPNEDSQKRTSSIQSMDTENDPSGIDSLEWRRNFAYIIYGGIFIGLCATWNTMLPFPSCSLETELIMQNSNTSHQQLFPRFYLIISSADPCCGCHPLT